MQAKLLTVYWSYSNYNSVENLRILRTYIEITLLNVLFIDSTTLPSFLFRRLITGGVGFFFFFFFNSSARIYISLQNTLIAFRTVQERSINEEKGTLERSVINWYIMPRNRLASNDRENRFPISCKIAYAQRETRERKKNTTKAESKHANRVPWILSCKTEIRHPEYFVFEIDSSSPL